jgi:hypothetical protein
LDINEQLAREVDYLKTGNQVLKSQLKETGKRLKFTDEQRRQFRFAPGWTFIVWSCKFKQKIHGKSQNC